MSAPCSIITYFARYSALRIMLGMLGKPPGSAAGQIDVPVQAALLYTKLALHHHHQILDSAGHSCRLLSMSAISLVI